MTAEYDAKLNKSKFACEAIEDGLLGQLGWFRGTAQ